MHGKGQFVKGISAFDDSLGFSGSSARSKHDAGVVGRGIGIDRHLIEGLLNGREQQGVERRRLDGGIGSNDRDHGGHIGHDHARALAHAAHRISVARMTRSLTAVANGILFGVRIGRHDGTGRIGTAMGRECLVGGRNGRLKRVNRQNLSNHACGCN